LGYIGSHTVVELLAEGYDVVIIDNLVNSSINILQRIEKLAQREVVFYQGDICDDYMLKIIFEKHKITHVIHFAGLKAVGESNKWPLKYYNNNVAGTLNLLSHMLMAEVNNFIFSSSATVYGQPEKIPLTELCHTGNTTNPYGTSKYFAERIFIDVSKANPNFNVTLLRYFNPVGAHASGLLGETPSGIPNNLMPYVSLVAAKKLDYLSIFGSDYPTKDGTGIRDYIHVMDLAKGHIAALKKNNNSLKIYNLGTGKGYSVLELIAAFEENNGVKVNYKFCPRREGDVAECWSDPSLAEKELGWKAIRNIDDMVRDVWRWQKNSALL
jgi:UDP-glucose 4-epimerase